MQYIVRSWHGKEQKRRTIRIRCWNFERAREKEKWRKVRERQENGSFISPIFRGKRSIFSVLSETLQSDPFSYPVAQDVIQEAAREANKRGMVAGGLALNTRATFKGDVIKMAKLLLINLAGPFFDAVPTGTQFVRVERRPPTIRTAFQLDFWFYWNALTHINRQFWPSSAAIDSVLPFRWCFLCDFTAAGKLEFRRVVTASKYRWIHWSWLKFTMFIRIRRNNVCWHSRNLARGYPQVIIAVYDQTRVDTVPLVKKYSSAFYFLYLVQYQNFSSKIDTSA